MKNVVLIGGGTGNSTIVQAIKDLDDINLYVIVTVADSGGSTGKIREEYNVPAIGDIRQLIVSLSQNESLLMELMQYRFTNNNESKNNTISNHSLGNLILLALINIKKDFYDGIKYLSSVFNIKGEIIPVTDNYQLQLKAIYEDGSFQTHEHLIPNKNKKIDSITYENFDFKTNPRAIFAIENADYIIFGCGSLYTSIIANIAIPQIKQALLENKKAQFIYLSNLVTQPDETNNMDAYDHIKAIEKHLAYGKIDTIIINNQKPAKKLENKYTNAGHDFIFVNDNIKKSHCQIIEAGLIDNNNEENIRHDIKKVRKVLSQLIKE